MSKQPKTKYGYGKCERCTSRVVVKINELDTLSYTCDECDKIGYARKGEAGYEKYKASLERTAPVKEPAPAAPTAAAPKPEAKPAATMPWMRPAAAK